MKKIPSWLLLAALVAFAIGYAYESRAQTVTAVMSGCGGDRCALLDVTGAPVPVNITVSNGAYFDNCAIAGAPAATTPPLGGNNDGLNATTFRVTPPFRCDFVEFDGSPDQWAGGTLTSGTASANFVNNAGTWTATLTLAPPGRARPVELTWVPPTQNEDGTAYTNPGGYVLYYGTASRSYTNTQRVDNPQVVMAEISALNPGVQYYFTATAINTAGVESLYSNEATITTTLAPLAPNPPTNTNATQTEGVQIAYAIFQTTDAIALVPVGTVDDGTPCNPNVSVQDDNARLAFKVPKESVSFLPDTEAELVFATCAN